MIDASGTLWILIAVVSAVILALGLLYASQQAEDVPRDAVTLRLKRKQTKENFSDTAVQEKPLFAESEAKPEPMKAEVAEAEAKKPRKRRPRVSRQAHPRRGDTRPSSHTMH